MLLLIWCTQQNIPLLFSILYWFFSLYYTNKYMYKFIKSTIFWVKTKFSQTPTKNVTVDKYYSWNNNYNIERQCKLKCPRTIPAQNQIYTKRPTQKTWIHQMISIQIIYLKCKIETTDHSAESLTTIVAFCAKGFYFCWPPLVKKFIFIHYNFKHNCNIINNYYIHILSAV